MPNCGFSPQKEMLSLGKGRRSIRAVEADAPVFNFTGRIGREAGMSHLITHVGALIVFFGMDETVMLSC
jgi:hypothetical protein